MPKAHDPTWYIPDIMLKNPSQCQKVEQALKEYLMHNNTPDISPLTLWEAHKPVLRGNIQRLMALFKRERKILARKLENDFNAASISFQNNPSPNTKSRLEKMRIEYDLFLMETADKTYKRTRHNFYTKTNKPGTYLA